MHFMQPNSEEVLQNILFHFLLNLVAAMLILHIGINKST